MAMNCVVFVSVLFFISVEHTSCQTKADEASADPPGHNQPFGSHLKHLEISQLKDFPEPKTFFNDYMMSSKPFVVKSVLNGKTFPAVEKWTDDLFRKELGEEIIATEKALKEIRNLQGEMMTFSQFLDRYTKEELYMVHTVNGFKTNDHILNDVFVPRSLFCGGLQSLIDALVMWFSGGGTKSVLHSDDYENFNCVLDGTKELIFVDRKYHPEVTASGWNHDGEYSNVDVDKVDMYKFPMLKQVPVYKVVLKKGDCLYIPYRWFHQVNSPGKRSLALNFWFLPTRWFNNSDCKGKDLSPSTKSVKEFRIRDTEENLWMTFVYIFDDKEFTKEQFEMKIHKTAPEMDKIQAQLFEKLDRDGSSTVTTEELYTANKTQIIHDFPVLQQAFANPDAEPEEEPEDDEEHDEL